MLCVLIAVHFPQNATNWWLANRDRYSHVHDVHLIVFVNLLRAFRTALEKLDNERNGDYDGICREFDEEVARLVETGNSFFTEYTDRTGEPTLSVIFIH